MLFAVFVNYIVNIVLLEYTYAELCDLIPSTNRTARVWTRFFGEVWSCHILHGSAIPVLTATGLVNGRWQFSNPHWIHTKNLVHFWLRRRSLRLCQIWCKSVLGGFWANEWNITKNFYNLFIPFSGTHLQDRPVGGFSCSMAPTTWTNARMYFFFGGGGSLILLHVFVGVNGCCDNRKQVQSPKADTKRDRVTVPVTLHDCCVTSKLQD